LVVRHLPATFVARGPLRLQLLRAAVAVVVGVFMGTVAVVSVSARQHTSVSEEHLRRALPEGDGQNVVNVILVDFRAFDTFGEIVVLTAAALGVVGLIRAVRRERARRGEARIAMP